MFSSYTYDLVEAGCDEAGRGCLAGPVVAAVVIFPKGYKNKLINDSKKLSFKKREKAKISIEKEALDYAVSFVDHKQIDNTSILKATFQAMHQSINKLVLQPSLLLVDGNYFIPFENIKHKCLIKGDTKYIAIAAASILAKTYRDKYMIQLSEKFPGYGWDHNMGYPTKEHRECIRQLGHTVYHRMSFQLLPK